MFAVYPRLTPRVSVDLRATASVRGTQQGRRDCEPEGSRSIPRKSSAVRPLGVATVELEGKFSRGKLLTFLLSGAGVSSTTYSTGGGLRYSTLHSSISFYPYHTKKG